jgi:uncharacterized protein YcbK (DUF882 family)
MMDENKLKLWADVKHFKFSEFDDPTEKDSGLNMSIEFIHLLDQLRTKVGFPFEVNSGFRTEAHNNAVGGKPESAHTKGLAADIHCSTSGDRYEIVARALELGFKRCGIGDSFVHLDLSFDLPQRVLWLYPPGVKG